MGVSFKSNTEKQQEEFNELQPKMVKEGKRNAREIILSRFYEDHQLNLYDGTKTDIPDMWSTTGERVSEYQTVVDFKRNVIGALHDIEQAVLNATTLDEVKDIDNSHQAIIDNVYTMTSNEVYNINWEDVKENIID